MERYQERERDTQVFLNLETYNNNTTRKTTNCR